MIRLVLADRQPRVGSVQHVIDQAPSPAHSGRPMTATHQNARAASITVPDTFSLSASSPALA
jgi:hypothetical protein